MIRSLVLLTSFALVTVVACGSSDEGVSAGPTSATPRVGEGCAGTQACGPGERCLIDEPGGLCVKPCAESGSAADCPSGSLCDRDSFLTGPGKEEVLVVCLRRCEDKDECRTQYDCSGVSKGSGKVCRKAGS